MRQTLKDKYDVVIVGGGIIGCTIAYFLSSNPDFNGSILILEKDPSYQKSSTALSVGGIRHQFSTPENIRMSMFGSQYFKDISSYLSANADPVKIDFMERHYLFLASPEGAAVQQSNLKVQGKTGADVSFLKPLDLQNKYPWLQTNDLAGGTLGNSGEGWIDPYSLLTATRKKLEHISKLTMATGSDRGTYFLKDELVEIQHNGQMIESVSCLNNGRIKCGTLINASGVQASRVARLAGINDFPVHPRKRQVHVFRTKQAIHNCPMVIDPGDPEDLFDRSHL